jgi:hypothetical protein
MSQQYLICGKASVISSNEVVLLCEVHNSNIGQHITKLLLEAAKLLMEMMPSSHCLFMLGCRCTEEHYGVVFILYHLLVQDLSPSQQHEHGGWHYLEQIVEISNTLPEVKRKKPHY